MYFLFTGELFLPLSLHCNQIQIAKLSWPCSDPNKTKPNVSGSPKCHHYVDWMNESGEIMLIRKLIQSMREIINSMVFCNVLNKAYVKKKNHNSFYSYLILYIQCTIFFGMKNVTRSHNAAVLNFIST